MQSKQYGNQPSIEVTLNVNVIKKSRPNEKVYHNGGSIYKGCEWNVKI